MTKIYVSPLRKPFRGTPVGGVIPMKRVYADILTKMGVVTKVEAPKGRKSRKADAAVASSQTDSEPLFRRGQYERADQRASSSAGAVDGDGYDRADVTAIDRAD